MQYDNYELNANIYKNTQNSALMNVNSYVHLYLYMYPLLQMTK